MNEPAPPEYVVLLHGFGCLPGVMQPLSLSLRRAGYRTLLPWYDSWRLPLPAIVDRLSRKIGPFMAEAEALGAPLHFVGHSMGGLVARALITRLHPASLGRVVMLGTPNKGSELADFLNRWSATRGILGHAAPALITDRHPRLEATLGPIDYPLGVVAGNRPMLRGISDHVMPKPHDGKVSVASTHLAEEADHMTLPLSHMMLAYHAMAHRQVIRFLSQGQFERA